MDETAMLARAEDVLAILGANEAELRAAGIRHLSLFGPWRVAKRDRTVTLTFWFHWIARPMSIFSNSSAWKNGYPNCWIVQST